MRFYKFSLQNESDSFLLPIWCVWSLWGQFNCYFWLWAGFFFSRSHRCDFYSDFTDFSGNNALLFELFDTQVQKKMRIQKCVEIPHAFTYAVFVIFLLCAFIHWTNSQSHWCSRNGGVYMTCVCVFFLRWDDE